MIHPPLLEVTLEYIPDECRLSSVYLPDTNIAKIRVRYQQCKIEIQADMLALPHLLDTLEAEITSLRTSHSNHLLNSLDQAVRDYDHDRHHDRHTTDREDPDE